MNNDVITVLRDRGIGSQATAITVIVIVIVENE